MKPKKKQKIQDYQGWHFDTKQIMYGLALIAYIVIPTFTPNLMALDTNTPKFFATSLLNLFVFCGILALEDRKQISSFAGRFFSTNVGMVYAFFMAAVLLSFTQAINLSESLLQFMKIFTVFAAVINLTFILNRDPGYIKYIIIVMTGLLLFDTISVFYYINKFISGDIARILDIKTVYSNKNILSSAIFVKLPFALWLMIFEKGWLKKVALVAFAFGITATLFMATRAFYLGFIIISIAFLVSAERRNGKTDWVRIKSLAGAPCTIRPGFAGSFNSSSPSVKIKKSGDGLYELSLKKGEEVVLFQK